MTRTELSFYFQALQRSPDSRLCSVNSAEHDDALLLRDNGQSRGEGQHALHVHGGSLQLWSGYHTQ